jgi:hypothetical protein
LVVGEQTGVPPVHWPFDRQPTQRFVVVSQCGAFALVQFTSDTQHAGPGLAHAAALELLFAVLVLPLPEVVLEPLLAALLEPLLAALLELLLATLFEPLLEPLLAVLLEPLLEALLDVPPSPVPASLPRPPPDEELPPQSTSTIIGIALKPSTHGNSQFSFALMILVTPPKRALPTSNAARHRCPQFTSIRQQCSAGAQSAPPRWVPTRVRRTDAIGPDRRAKFGAHFRSRDMPPRGQHTAGAKGHTFIRRMGNRPLQGLN